MAQLGDAGLAIRGVGCAPVTDIVVITIEVVEPGSQADAILDCLRRNYGLDPQGGNRSEIMLARADLTHEQGSKEIAKALGDCDQDWSRFLHILPPPRSPATSPTP